MFTQHLSGVHLGVTVRPHMLADHIHIHTHVNSPREAVCLLERGYGVNTCRTARSSQQCECSPTYVLTISPSRGDPEPNSVFRTSRASLRRGTSARKHVPNIQSAPHPRHGRHQRSTSPSRVPQSTTQARQNPIRHRPARAREGNQTHPTRKRSVPRLPRAPEPKPKRSLEPPPRQPSPRSAHPRRLSPRPSVLRADRARSSSPLPALRHTNARASTARSSRATRPSQHRCGLAPCTARSVIRVRWRGAGVAEIRRARGECVCIV